MLLILLSVALLTLSSAQPLSEEVSNEELLDLISDVDKSNSNGELPVPPPGGTGGPPPRPPPNGEDQGDEAELAADPQDGEAPQGPPQEGEPQQGPPPQDGEPQEEPPADEETEQTED
ncbi:hypothetical protein Cadr_000029265 [Camelus dromedarius]|uniref:Uncharacterized protein n=3 Tax=Camelus TaxID=9836 RepID=A0A5N4C634_CAMDR|nr:basic salivary proline-rich protein 2 [Camelus bactrianus]XP_010984525.1 basic salivary proline-rich protein 2 [Camelus dromedarius]XP_014420990.1 basic salivary proline-rich protein 2 [Camelus ferus]KAB1254368.1 hypothetical protein Cadr_000029265 [Camelus dromedarius]